MMMIDPRTVEIIHEQKVKEILQGKERNYIGIALPRLLAALRNWFTGIRQRVNTKSTYQSTYKMTGYDPCSE